MATPEDATESLDGWNPLKEAYYDTNFNSYTSGPGANIDQNLQIPFKGNEEQRVYKLYVKKIPLTLSQVGLRNIFAHFGVVKSTFIAARPIKSKYTWGMVEYFSLGNAQDAIIAINLQPPYNLEVQFAMSEEKKRRLSAEQKLLDEVDIPRARPSEKKGENSSEDMTKMIYCGLLPQTIPLSTICYDDIAFDHTFYNHYSRNYASSATHRLYSYLLFENKITDYLISENSNTSSQLLTPVSVFTGRSEKLVVETENVLLTKPAYDKQNDSVYEFGTEFSNCEKCQLCKAVTATSCKNCPAWYCGVKCFRKHWPEHKLYCTSSSNLSNGNISQNNGFVMNDGTTLVYKQKLTNSLPIEETASNSFEKPKSITVFLKEGFTGLLQIRESLSASKFVAFMFCNELPDCMKILMEVSDTVSNLPFDESFTPKVGEVVGLESAQVVIGMEWVRGYIYAKGEAVLCDYGHRVKLTKFKQLPQPFCTLPSLAVYCSLLDCSKSKEEFESEFVQNDNQLEFVVTRCNENGTVEASFTCETNETLTGKVRFSPYTYFRHVNIRSGSKVTLSAFYNCALVYIQSNEPVVVELFEKLMQDVGAHCQTEKSLDIEPVPGDMVAVQNSKDGNWYRGQILEKEDGGFQVIYVDFGNMETVSLTHMKPLSSHLKATPCFAVRVGLADIHPATPLTNLALLLLKNLCESSEPLKIEFLNNDFSSVKLIRHGKVSLSEELEIRMEPGWKVALKRGLDPTGGQVFMMDDLVNCVLTEGKEYQLRVLLMNIPPKEFTLCSTRSDVSKHVMGTLSSQLNEYCSALTSNSYNPRIEELCIVRLEDDGCWYRAVCLENLFTISQSRVMFVDFGNCCVVSHKNIRRFCEDFITTPAMTIMCTYEGIPENCAEKLNKRIEELIQPNEEYTILVNSLNESTFYYNIDIPSVTSVLKKENLL